MCMSVIDTNIYLLEKWDPTFQIENSIGNEKFYIPYGS